jgi:hypothetical protein
MLEVNLFREWKVAHIESRVKMTNHLGWASVPQFGLVLPLFSLGEALLSPNSSS